MALTATANERVIGDVIDRLNIAGCVRLKQSFNRHNLRYEVRTKKRNVMADIHAFIKTHEHETGIIYCLSRAKCEEVAKELRDKYAIRARHYHAQLSPEDKHRTQQAWQLGECEVIVATVSSSARSETREHLDHSPPVRSPSVWELTSPTVRTLCLAPDSGETHGQS